MAIFENNAEGQANGTGIAASQSGSGDAFSLVTQSGSATGTYSTNTASHGSKSYHITGGSGDVFHLRFDGSSASSSAVRFYIYLVALPSAASNIVELRTTAGQQNAAIGLSTAGKLQVKDAAGTVLMTFAMTLNITTWYRVELQATVGASSTTGSISAAYFSGDSTTALDTAFTSTTVNAGAANNLYVRYGKITSASTLDVYVDDLAWNNGDATAIGPYASSSNQIPTANAGADQSDLEPYETVTLVGTDSDADGTVANRQWRQIAGSPTVTLVGATSASCSYIAPGTLAGTNLTFGYRVTDNNGAQSVESTVQHAVQPVTERAVIGGVEVPVQTSVVLGGTLQ